MSEYFKLRASLGSQSAAFQQLSVNAPKHSDYVPSRLENFKQGPSFRRDGNHPFISINQPRPDIYKYKKPPSYERKFTNYDSSTTYSDYLRNTADPKYLNQVLKTEHLNEDSFPYLKRNNFAEYRPFEKDYDSSFSLRDIRPNQSKFPEFRSEQRFGETWSQREVGTSKLRTPSGLSHSESMLMSTDTLSPAKKKLQTEYSEQRSSFYTTTDLGRPSPRKKYSAFFETLSSFQTEEFSRTTYIPPQPKNESVSSTYQSSDFERRNHAFDYSPHNQQKILSSQIFKKKSPDHPEATMTPKYDKRFLNPAPKRYTNMPPTINNQYLTGSRTYADEPSTTSLANFNRIQQPRISSKVSSKVSSPVSTVQSAATGSASGNRSPTTKLRIQDFSIGKAKGEGRFGQVFVAQHKLSRTLYALKRIPKRVIKKNGMEKQLALEIKLQSYFNHPNILALHGFFDDQEHIYMLLDYMEEGTLYEEMQRRKNKFSEKEVSRIIAEVASAVEYLQDLDIVHRDIKPENIVFSHGVAKLCDFGWATLCATRRTTYCGTFDYAAPDILEGKDYDKTVDLWCLGVLTFELLTGKVPFYHPSRKETTRLIINVDKEPIKFPPEVSPEARDFIENLVQKESEDRMKPEDIKNHIFIKKYASPY